MTIELDVQNDSSCKVPSQQSFELWASAALEEIRPDAELSIKIIDEAGMIELNKQYRGKDASTNVLSFPADIPAELEIELLGDIAICGPVIEQEARQQGKSASSHYAHMTVHGVLHLAGFDHIEEDEAEQMESLEIKILNRLGFANPYDQKQDPDQGQGQSQMNSGDKLSA